LTTHKEKKKKKKEKPEREKQSKEKERKDNMRISVIPMDERKKNDVMYIR
jgi:hypothetical protein